MHLDIKCAFQTGKLYDIVYVVQPSKLGDNSGQVWKLNKALYGLKQAARDWHQVLVILSHELDLVCSHSDPGLHSQTKYGRCIIFIWADDLLVFTTADVMETLCVRILSRFKAGVEAKLDMSQAWKSCVVERHRP